MGLIRKSIGTLLQALDTFEGAILFRFRNSAFDSQTFERAARNSRAAVIARAGLRGTGATGEDVPPNLMDR
jgi:hypothetical protein